MIRSLLWKEWREHRWMAATVTAVAMSMAALYNRREGDEIVLLVLAAVLWLSPIGMAAFDIVSEKTAKTDRLMGALPAPRIVVFLIRSLIGVLSLLLPVIAALIYASAEGAVIDAVAWTIACLYFATLAVGMGMRRGGRVVITGIGLCLLLYLVETFAVVALMLRGEPTNRSIDMRWPLMFPWHASHPLVATVQLFVSAALWSIAFWRFNRLPNRMSGIPQVDRRAVVVTEPVNTKSRKAAFPFPLLWKEWREQRKIVLGTASVAMLIAFSAGAAVMSREEAWIGASTFFSLLFVLGVITPTALAVILGQSAFSGDLDERLGGFWRTRPFNPAALFRAKLIIASGGVLLLLLTFISVGGLGEAMVVTSHWDSGPPQLSREEVWGIIVGQIVWLPFVLVLSMLAAVLLRNAILSSIVSVIAVTSLLIVPISLTDTVSTGLAGGPINEDYIIAAIGMIIAMIFMIWCGQRIFLRNQVRQRGVLMATLRHLWLYGTFTGETP